MHISINPFKSETINCTFLSVEFLSLINIMTQGSKGRKGIAEMGVAKGGDFRVHVKYRTLNVFCFIISLKLFYFLKEVCLIAHECGGIIFSYNSLDLNLFYIERRI